jgi:hypothetical protein
VPILNLLSGRTHILRPMAHLAGTTTATATATMLATYAALVSTGALLVQALGWLKTWRTRVTVTLQLVEVHAPGQAADASIVFRLINHSGHPVKITLLGLTPVCRHGPRLIFPRPQPLSSSVPFEIQPRDALALREPASRLADGNPRHKTRAFVKTSDDKIFRSRRLRVGDLASTLPGPKPEWVVMRTQDITSHQKSTPRQLPWSRPLTCIATRSWRPAKTPADAP